MKSIAGLAGILMLGFTQCGQQDSPAKPNIVIINVDDMGWRDTSFMGSQFYETPNIDSLASLGMFFTNGYATAANCSPSRACLMTGLWTPRHGIYTVGSSERGRSKDRKLVPIENNTTLADERTTLPEVLSNHGYTSCLAGKWHLSDNPENHGFDINIGGGHNGHPKSYYPPYGNVDLKDSEGAHLTDAIMSKAMDFVRNVASPFFLYYTPYAVHTPIQGIDSLKHYYLDKPQWQAQHNIDYATMIHNLDRNIGRLVATLKETGNLDNTLIIFTSDNGGLYGVTYQYPLRAGKGSYFEGGIRVPFYFSWNGNIEAGTTSHIPISNLDIFPTILAAAGIDYGELKLDGQSLFSILTGKKQFEDRPLFWHFPVYLQAYDVNNNQNRDSLFRTRPGSVVRYGDWKLHHYFEDDGLELYNLRDDIGEKNNLVQQKPGKRNELYQLLDNWRNQVNAPIPTNLNPGFSSGARNGYTEAITN
jgi:arylsulfatase A-like enzyme